jgi:hypothetical protein
MVLLGDGLFAKRSVAQALEILERRLVRVFDNVQRASQAEQGGFFNSHHHTHTTPQKSSCFALASFLSSNCCIALGSPSVERVPA